MKNIFKTHGGLCCCSYLGGKSDVVDSLCVVECVGVLYFGLFCGIELLIVLSSFAFVEEERAGCFILIVFMLSFGWFCSPSRPNPVAGGWSVISGCGISWSLITCFLMI